MKMALVGLKVLVLEIYETFKASNEIPETLFNVPDYCYYSCRVSTAPVSPIFFL